MLTATPSLSAGNPVAFYCHGSRNQPDFRGGAFGCETLARAADRQRGYWGAATAVDKAGTIHNAADSETEVLEHICRFLSYLPQNVWELRPVVSCGDPVNRCESALRQIVPQKRTSPYDMRLLISLLVDKGSIFEIQPSHGKSIVTSLVRLDGRVAGVIANNPKIYSGAMDTPSAHKQIHFMELCDTFHIPLVFLVDVPGFMIGLKAEQEATLREGMRVDCTAGQLAVPTITLVIRKCYGMADWNR